MHRLEFVIAVLMSIMTSSITTSGSVIPNIQLLRSLSPVHNKDIRVAKKGEVNVFDPCGV
jgi:hypothetical protein